MVIEADRVTWRDADGREETIDAGVVVLCTGPSRNAATAGRGLIAALLDSGVARRGRLGFGLELEGRVSVAGPASGRLWAVGPLQVGELWESTSMSVIRVQAAAAAEAIARKRS